MMRVLTNANDSSTAVIAEGILAKCTSDDVTAPDTDDDDSYLDGGSRDGPFAEGDESSLPVAPGDDARDELRRLRRQLAESDRTNRALQGQLAKRALVAAERDACREENERLLVALRRATTTAETAMNELNDTRGAGEARAKDLVDLLLNFQAQYQEDNERLRARLARAAQESDALARELRAAREEATELPLYRTRVQELSEALRRQEDVRGCVYQGGQEGDAWPLASAAALEDERDTGARKGGSSCGWSVRRRRASPTDVEKTKTERNCERQPCAKEELVPPHQRETAASATRAAVAPTNDDPACAMPFYEVRSRDEELRELRGVLHRALHAADREHGGAGASAESARSLRYRTRETQSDSVHRRDVMSNSRMEEGRDFGPSFS